MRAFWSAVADVLWPHALKCLCCDEYSEGEMLCPACQEALDAMCMSGDGVSMTQSAYRYEGMARRLVIQLKDGCVADAAVPLAKGIADVIRTLPLPQDTVLTWVTMPTIRRKKRGIDHGKVLCQVVSEETGFPVRQLLMRTRNAHTQRGLTREQRLQNLSGTIECTQRISGTVLLIDDVMTTGATASVCAVALKQAGASAVYAVTATRAVLHG